MSSLVFFLVVELVEPFAAAVHRVEHLAGALGYQQLHGAFPELVRVSEDRHDPVAGVSRLHLEHGHRMPEYVVDLWLCEPVLEG